jgi:hypothetical protein
MTKPNDRPAATGNRTEGPPRRPYQKPELQLYGDLAEITKTVTGSRTNDGAGHPNMHFTS